MSLSAQTLSALQELMAQNKELLAQVQATDDAAQAAAIIADAAAKNGIQTIEAELAKHFEEASKAASNQALSDQQLEAVAGGLDDDAVMVLMSIFSLGLGCAVTSIIQGTGQHIGFQGHIVKKYC